MGSNNVIVISQVPPPTHGSTIMTKILLEVLSEEGHRATLVDRRFSRAVDEVGSLSFRKIAAAPSLILRLLLRVMRRPDVCVFFCTNRPFSFLVDVMLAEVLRLFRVPTINYVHTSGYRDLASRGSVWRWLVRRLLAQGASTVCLAESLSADVRPFVGARPIVVIPNTIDERPVVDRHGARPASGAIDSGEVLFLSNLLADKGADVFVDMAIALCQLSGQLTFALVGQPADRALVHELQERVAQSGYASRVKFLGPMYGEQKWNVLARAQLLVFPSRYRFEAQPLSIIEAFSVGVPVIASDVGAISEMVSSENGRLLSQPTVDEAVRAVSLLISDPMRRQAASDGARRTFAKRHSREAFQTAWRNVIKSVQKGAM